MASAAVAALALQFVALFLARARLPYESVLAITMLALPVQVWLVRNGHLSCDGP